MYTPTTRISVPLLGLVALLMSLLAASCKKNKDSTPPLSQDYLGEVTGGGDFFRWTPRRGATSIVVPIEIDDVTVPSEWNSSMIGLVEQARDAWKASIRTTTTFDTATRRLGSQSAFATDYTKLLVRFTSQLPGNRLGQVEFRLANATTVAGLTMTIAMRSPLDGRLLTDAEKLGVLLHEFGHAYGLFHLGAGEGHSSSPGDVMYFASTRTALSSRDIATIRKLYSLTPAAVRSDSLTTARVLLPDMAAVIAGS